MKSICNSIILVLVFFFISCKLAPLTELDSRYVLLPEDVPNNIFTGLKTKQYYKENPYFFTKSKYLGEFACTYTAHFEGPQSKNIKFQTQIGVSSNEVRARQLYDSFTNLLKKYITNIDPEEYNASEVSCIETPNYFYLVILRNKIVYCVTIENIEIKEIELRSALIKKLDHLNDLVGAKKI